MKFPENYKILGTNSFSIGEYKIVPIRYEDRFAIMQWRNEQMYHLRQNQPLAKEDQDTYFENVVALLFEKDQPEQILFSYLKDDECIGYGGLVHINWIDKNAEISFIMNTQLEKEAFAMHWAVFLDLIKQAAFEDLKFHKVFTYAFDLRPHLYPVLEKSGFRKEAELKEHCFFNGKFISVFIHSKTSSHLSLRKAAKKDIEKTFQWANDPVVRAYSYNQTEISKEEHTDWFLAKLNSKECEYYILEMDNKVAGSIRFDIEGGETAKINYLIDPHFTGRGLGTLILEMGTKQLYEERPEIKRVYGYVLKENIASKKIFEKQSFLLDSENKSELKFSKIL